jgi:hypothetical protein
MRADRIRPVLAVQAHGEPVAAHLDEGGVPTFLRQSHRAFERETMRAEPVGGERPEQIGFAAEKIAAGQRVLLGKAGIDQRNENAPAGRLRKTGSRDQLRKARAPAAMPGDETQQSDGARDALRPRSIGLAARSPDNLIHIVDPAGHVDIDNASRCAQSSTINSIGECLGPLYGPLHKRRDGYNEGRG